MNLSRNQASQKQNKRKHVIIAVSIALVVAVISGIVISTVKEDDSIDYSAPGYGSDITQCDEQYIDTEGYIMDNADRSIIGDGNLMPADAATVTTTIVSDDFPGKSLDDLWSDQDGDDVADYWQDVLNNTASPVLLYKTSDDAQYYVGKIGNISDGYEFLQALGGLNDTSGTVYDDIKYDATTGLVYIPAQHKKDNGDKYDSVRVQLLYKAKSQDKTTDVNVKIESKNVNGREATAEGIAPISASSPTASINIADTYDTKRSINDATIDSVTINSVEYPIESNVWSYDRGAGTLDINMSPVDIDAVDVKMSNSLVKTAKRALNVGNASASNIGTIPTVWTVTGEPQIGSTVVSGSELMKDNPGSYVSGDDSNTIWGAVPKNVGNNYNNMITHMIDSLIRYSNLTVNDLPDLDTRTMRFYNFRVWINDQSGVNIGGASYDMPGQRLALYCAHIGVSTDFRTPGTFDRSYTKRGSGYNRSIRDGQWLDTNLHINVLDVDRSNQIVTFAVVAPTTRAQAGVGVFKARYKKKYGHIRMTKTAHASYSFSTSEGDPVSGAVFNVYGDSSCTRFIRQGTTDGNGSITFENLEPGTYYLKEQSAPWPYIVSNDVHAVQVYPGGTSSTSFADDTYGTVEMHKASLPAESTYNLDDFSYADGKKISATATTAQSTETNGAYTVSYTITLSGNGSISNLKLKLPDEIKYEASSSGKIVSEPSGDITVSNLRQGESLSFTGTVPIGWSVDETTANLLTVYNANGTETGNITAPLNGKPVDGATYRIYKTEDSARNDTNSIGTITIGSDGSGSYGLNSNEKLEPYATYYLKENSTVNDYKLDPTIRSFTTTPNLKTIVFTADEFTPTIITKQSKYPDITMNDTRFSLSGSVFKFYVSKDDATNDVSDVFTIVSGTDDNGESTAYTTGLHSGTYYVKESKAPRGYWQGSDALGSGDIKQITIQSGKLNTLEYDDTIPVNIQPSKTSDNKVALTLKQYPLSGAIFCLYDNEQAAYARYSTVEDAQNAAVATFTTGENGQTSAKTVGLLDAYWLREVKAPWNYQLDSNINNTVKKITYDDFKANTTQSPVFSNTPKPMSLSIKKTAPQVGMSTINANNSKYSLAGAKIRVYKTEQDAVNNTNYVREVTTRQDGSTTTITDLPPASSYYVKEVAAPSSGAYTVNSTVYQVKYEENNSISQSCTVPESMKPVRITINKKLANGEVTNSLYSFKGTRFGVYSTKAAADRASEADPGDRLSGLIGVYTITSDDQTSVTTDSLPWQQHYYVRELTAASSFKVNNDTFDVDVTDGSGTGTGSTSLTIGNEYLGAGINVEDVPSYCYVKIRKNADGVSMPHNGYSLAGAVFGLYKTKSEADAASSLNLGSPLYCITTEDSSDGSYSMGISGLLSAGVYYLKEIEAPIGFAPSSQTYQVEAKEGPKPGSTTQTVPYDNDSVKNEREHLATVNAASSAKASISAASSNDNLTDNSDNAVSNDTETNSDIMKQDGVKADEEGDISTGESTSSSNEDSNASNTSDYSDASNAGLLSDASEDTASIDGIISGSNQIVASFDNGKPDNIAYDDKITGSSDTKYVYDVSNVDKSAIVSSLKDAGADVAPANVAFSTASDNGPTINIDDASASDVDNNVAVSSISQDVPDFSGQNVVAVIDTGVADNVDGVIGKYSVLGDDGSDVNGHGSSMAYIIHEQYPNAKVVSIKALNDNGVGTITSVISAMDLAMKMNVKVINLSISAKATDDNSVIEKEISNAYNAGITVVGAAGNDGKDARGFVPGGVNQALIVGACDVNGNKIDSSNFGSTVDFYVKAGSTSEAAARMSAMSAEAFDNNSDIASIDKPDILFLPDENKQYKESTGYNGSGADGQFRTQFNILNWIVSDVNDSTFTLYGYWPTDDPDWNASDWFKRHSWAHIIQNDEILDTTQLVYGNWSISHDGESSPYNVAFTFNKGSVDYSNANTYIRIHQDNGGDGDSDGWGLLQRFQDSEAQAHNYFSAWVGKLTDRAYSNPYMTVITNDGYDDQHIKMMMGSKHYSTLTVPKKTGYDFTGYYEYGNGGAQVYDSRGNAVARDFTQATYAGHSDSDCSAPPWKWYWGTVSSFKSTHSDAGIPYDSVFVYPFDFKIEAHYTPHTYKIRFNANGGTGTMSDENMTYDISRALTRNLFTKEDYKFTGWNTKPDGTGTPYADAANVSNLASDNGAIVTLYAQWSESTYTVKFDNNGGGQGTTPDMSITTTQRKALSKNGYTRTFKVFKGWNTQRNGTGKWLTDQQTVGINDLKPFDSATKTLFAQWVDANDHSIDWDAIPLAATINDAPITTGIRITKTITSNAQTNGVQQPSLSGAVFGVYATRDAANAATYQNQGSPVFPVSRTTTDANGQITLTGLTAGNTYYIKELKAPNGYSLNNQVYTTTTRLNIMQDVTVPDKPNVLSIMLRKTGTLTSGSNVPAWYSAKHPLVATYGVYDSKSKADNATPANPGSPVTRITTDARGNGVATIIRADNTTYYLKELIKPEGYELDTSTHAITVNGNKTESASMVLFTANPSVTDSVPCGNISLSKNVTNADSDVDMSSVSYSLYGSEDDARTGKNAITSCRLSSTGHGVISNIPYGDYWLKENPAHAPNLETDTEAHKVTVTRSTVNVPTITTHLSDRLDTIGMYIEKRTTNTSSSTDVDLSGVQFSVYTDKACTTPYKRNGANLILTTAKDGSTGTVSVPNGTYYVKETSAPSHLKVNDTVYTVTQANNIVYAEDDVVVADCSISLMKKSNNPGYLDNDLSGAVFSVSKDRAGNQRVGTITTNRNGAGTLNNLLPGTYYVREVKALPGHDMDVDSNGNIRVYTVTLGGNSPKSATINGTTGIVNNTGSVKLKKSSADSSISNGNRMLDLSGAVYNVYIDENCTRSAGVPSLITDSNGDTNTVSGLRSGTYYMKEVQSPISGGYDVTSSPIRFEISADTNTVASPVIVSDAEKASKAETFTVKKTSSESGLAISSENNESNAEFSVRYYDDAPSNVSDASKPIRTWTLKTDKYGEARFDAAHKVSGDDFYTDDNGTPAFITGTLKITETKSPEGYLLPNASSSTKTYHVVNGNIYAVEPNGAESVLTSDVTFDDDVMRGDLELSKTDASTGKAMANVPFLITLMRDKDGDGRYETPVESHVIVTDANGKFSTKNTKHTLRTNANDALYTGGYDDITNIAMKSSSNAPVESGLWFFNGGAASTVDDSRGALPYGHYRIDEIHSDVNTGYSPLSYDNELVIDGDNKSVNVGTVLNHKITVRNTSATINSTKSKYDDGRDESKIITDTIAYDDAVPGEEYYIKVRAYDADSGYQYMMKADDDSMQMEKTVKFAPSNSSGSIDVQIDLSDDEDLQYGNVSLNVLLLNKDKEIASEHNADLRDSNETVHYRRIETKATDDDTGSHYANYSENGFAHTLNDKVSYYNLDAGKEYTATSTLHVKKYDAGTKTYVDAGTLKDKNGNDVTVSQSFTPSDRDGETTLSLPFSMSDDWHGAEVVSYTKITETDTGEVVCSHEDLTSEDQTVRYTYVDTTVLDDVTGRHSGHYSDSDPMSFTDTVRYENLAPDTEYVITMSMVNRKTGEQIKDVNGEPITSTSTIRTDSDNKGTISMKRSFNARSSADVSDAIIYEEITVNGEDAAWHKDLGDLDQNIRYGEVMMPSTGKQGLDYRLLGLIAGITAGIVTVIRRSIERRRAKKYEENRC